MWRTVYQTDLPACHGVLSKDALDFIVLSIEEPRLTNQVSKQRRFENFHCVEH